MIFVTCCRVGLQDLSSYLNKIVFFLTLPSLEQGGLSLTSLCICRKPERGDLPVLPPILFSFRGSTAVNLVFLCKPPPDQPWHLAYSCTRCPPYPSPCSLLRPLCILEHSPRLGADNRWLESAKGNLGTGKREKAVLKHSVARFHHVRAFTLICVCELLGRFRRTPCVGKPGCRHW